MRGGELGRAESCEVRRTTQNVISFASCTATPVVDDFRIDLVDDKRIFLLSNASHSFQVVVEDVLFYLAIEKWK